MGVLAKGLCKRNRRNSFSSAGPVPKRAISHAEGGSSRPPPWLAGTSRLDHVARNVAAHRGQRRGGVLSGSFSKGPANLLTKQARAALISSFSPASALHPKVISAPRCRKISAPPPPHRFTHLRTAHPEPKRTFLTFSPPLRRRQAPSAVSILAGAAFGCQLVLGS